MVKQEAATEFKKKVTMKGNAKTHVISLEETQKQMEVTAKSTSFSARATRRHEENKVSEDVWRRERAAALRETPYGNKKHKQGPDMRLSVA